MALLCTHQDSTTMRLCLGNKAMGNKIIGNKKIAAIVLGSLMLTACGGESEDSLPSLYRLGGTVDGLDPHKTVVLNNNDGENEISIFADGKFTFPEHFYLTLSYSISVKSQPQSQRCSVAHGKGNLSRGSVFNVQVICRNSGILDTSFDKDGIFVHHADAGGDGDNEGHALGLDTSERILVTGYSLNVSGKKVMNIWRYDPIGTYSNWQPAGGLGDDDEGHAIILDTEEKILVTGDSLKTAGNQDMILWRYKPDVTLDTSFDTDGIVVYDNVAGGSGVNVGLSMAQDAAGKILVTGYSQKISGDSDMTIWRYNPDGTLDISFDTDGVVVDNGAAGSGVVVGQSMALDADGKILVTGYSVNISSNKDMVIWRFNTDGKLDTSFGTYGIVVHDNAAGGSGDDEGLSIISAVTSETTAEISVTGYSVNISSNKDMVIWRYDQDGKLDTSFGTNGIVVHDGAAGGTGDDEGRSLALGIDGEVLVTGYSLNAPVGQSVLGNRDMVIWRYDTHGKLDTNFDTDGIVIHNSAAGGDGDDEGQSLMLDRNGKIMVTGYSYNASGNNASGNKDMVIWRYNP